MNFNFLFLASNSGATVVASWITYLFTGILVCMILALAFEEKLHAKKSVIVGLFAVVSLGLATILDILPFGLITLPNGHHLAMPVFIPAVDWNVILIILGSGLFVDVTSKSGLFTWIAIKLTKLSKGDPLKLLIYYCVMTIVFSAVLNNVTAMIIVGSLTAVSLGKLQRTDKLLGFLLIQGLLTNVGGLLTLISSVPNIIVGNAAGITFLDFFLKAAPYVAITSVITVALGAKLFQIKGLKTEEEKRFALEQVACFDENDGIASKGFFNFSAVMLLGFIATIAASSSGDWFLPKLELGFVAMAFGLIMLLRFKATADQFYQSIDWDLLAFFAALFATIYVMEHALVLELIGRGLKPIITLSWPEASQGILLVCSAAASAVTDNIPLAAMLAKILSQHAADLTAHGESLNPNLWWSVIFGANLGGNLTPIGSASTLVAVTIIHKNKIPMSFIRFVKMALPYAAIQIAVAVLYVLLILPLYG